MSDTNVPPPAAPPTTAPGVDPRTIPPPPAGAFPPAAPAEPGPDDRVAAANQEAMRWRQQAQQAQEQYAWAAALDENQQRYVRDLANALATGNANVAADLAQYLLPAQPPPPPPSQPVWDGYQWTYPQAPPPPPPPTAYPPPPQPSLNPLFGQPAPEPGAGLTPEAIAKIVSDTFANERRVDEMRRSVDSQRQRLAVPDLLHRAASELALGHLREVESQRQQNPSIQVPELGGLYAQFVEDLRAANLPALETNGGPATVPPSGVTPTPTRTPPLTQAERKQRAVEIAKLHGAT